MAQMIDSEADFYERKVRRLEDDMCILHEELTRLRLRLRTAQDYQIKYKILLKSSETDILKAKMAAEKHEQAKSQQKVATILKQNDERWTKQLMEQEERLKTQSQRQINLLKQDIQKANAKVNQLSHKKQEMELFNFKIRKFEKENEALTTQLQEIRTLYQKQKQEELNTLRLHLSTKSRQKLLNERKAFESKILSLEKKLSESEFVNDHQIFKEPQLNNNELIELKKTQDDSRTRHEEQLKQLQALLLRRNEQFKLLLREQTASNQNFIKQLISKNERIKSLESQLIEKEKQHESELILAISKGCQSKDRQISLLKDQIEELENQNAELQKYWNNKLKLYDEALQSQRRKYQSDLRSNEQNKAIKQEIMSNREHEKQIFSPVKINESRIHKTKEVDPDELQGITFLGQQLKKVQLKLQEKNRLCNKLNEDISMLRNQAEDQKSRLKQVQRNEITHLNDQMSQLQDHNQTLTDKIIQLNKQGKLSRKDLEDQRIDMTCQISGLKDIVHELQRDYRRLQQAKKTIQQALVAQKLKQSHSSSQLSTVIQQRIRALQQKNHNIETLFKIKREEENAAFKTSNQESKSLIKNLRENIERLQRQNSILKKSNQKNNKQNENEAGSNLEQKIATLNLEIALTERIYQSLKQTSSRANHQPEIE